MSSQAIHQTHYAMAGDAEIAYQVSGDGPIDVVFIAGWISTLESMRDTPRLNSFFDQFASFCRLIVFDKRGTGLSDRKIAAPTLEQRMDDVRAVMDAAGSEKAALFGASEGGPMAMLFAATYPERTTALILYGTSPRFNSDWPHGSTAELFEALINSTRETWGQGNLLHWFGASVADIPAARAQWGRAERLSLSPGDARAFFEQVGEIDVRPVLPAIRVPTLVIHRTDDRAVPVSAGHYLAEHIASARYWEQPGDHIPVLGDYESMLGEVEEFLTGARSTHPGERVLATVLFTDIVGSTERAAAMGDTAWRRLLLEHDNAARREIDVHRGNAIKQTGDGFLATFDGPARAVHCACALRDDVQSLGIQLRAGVHTGEIEMSGADIGGIAVHIGRRVEEEASPGEVLVSSTVRDLVAGSGLRFADRGHHRLKGVPDEWRLFAVTA